MGKRCGNCANGTWLKGMDAVPEVCLECKYVHEEPSNWKEKVQTNADRIRAMSDEELSRFLADKIANENTLSWLRLYDKANIHSATEIEAIRYQWYGYWRQWLKQPAEGE